MGLWCYIFGHKPKKPRKSRGESGLYTTCKRCDEFFVRGYFKGWQRATPSQKAYYLRMYGPDAQGPHDPKDDRPDPPHEETIEDQPVQEIVPEKAKVPPSSKPKPPAKPVTPVRRRRRRV